MDVSIAAITAPSIRNLGQDLLGRVPTSSQAPLQIHQSYPTDAEFHASSGPMSSSPDHVLLAFPLTRLRFSGSLHRSPSISRVESSVRLQLHLQHDSMVDDQSTPRPADFKLSCVHILESTPRHCHVEPRTPQACATCFHAHRIRTPSALTLLRRCR